MQGKERLYMNQEQEHYARKWSKQVNESVSQWIIVTSCFPEVIVRRKEIDC